MTDELAAAAIAGSALGAFALLRSWRLAASLIRGTLR